MLANYRCGWPADALAVFRRTRGRLAAELGVEPGPELQRLHQRILAGDPGLDLPPPGRIPAGARPRDDLGRPSEQAIPRQLPAAAAHFLGRDAELDTLTGLLAEHRRDRTTATILAIVGTAGVGKTALAVHWAHQVAERFPDGQLYVNLRGYDPEQPMTAADALAGFLRALGLPGQEVPAEETERAARYRSLLAGRRMLVLLDNASEVEQVRPLLPGSPVCAAIVTSRDSLAGLVARDGAERTDLDQLRLDDAVGLLRALIGTRVGDDPDAARTLALRCCRLPLALRVAAELAASRSATPLAGLASELADQQRRLDLLEAAGDRRTAMRAVFSWSSGHLASGAVRTFRLLGLHPGPDFEPYAAAALTGATVEQARQLLDELARAHLVQPASPGRYGMHDLLRTYARELAEASDGDEGHAALTRLFDYYLQAAAAAMDILLPAERHRRPRLSPSAILIPALASPAAARGWLDTERASLVAVAAHTAERGWPNHAIRLAATLFRYLDVGGHYPEAITIHTHARGAAQNAGDQVAEATALNDLVGVHWRQGRHQQAIGHLEQALALFRQAGNRAGQVRALCSLGLTLYFQGRYEKAASVDEQALSIAREVGDPAGEASLLLNLGVVEQRQGRYEMATRHQQQALTLSRKTGNAYVEAQALINLGIVSLCLGRWPDASGHLGQALVLTRTAGDVWGEAEALTRIGDISLRQGDPHEATARLSEALALCRETGNRLGEAEALCGLGEVQLAIGCLVDARTWYADALHLADRIGDKYQQARAHDGLGRLHQAIGDPLQARHHWQRALARYTELGTPEADQIRARLTPAADHGHLDPAEPRPGQPPDC
jgi:tetratricopeptide (TPR) repeat protein